MDEKQYKELEKELVLYGYSITKMHGKTEIFRQVCRVIRKEYMDYAINYLVYIYGMFGGNNTHRVEISIEVCGEKYKNATEIEISYKGQDILETERLAHDLSKLMKPYLSK